MAQCRLARLGVLTLLFAATLLVACGGARSRLAAHLERGKQFLEEGNYQKGGVELRNALQIDPKNVEAQVLYGRVSEYNTDYRAAVGAYRAALAVDENSAAARAALARIMVFAGETQQALELIEPALKKNPREPDLLTVRAAVRVTQKDLAGALADAELAHQVAPRNENAAAMLAAVYRQKNDLPRAGELVRVFVAQNPKSVDMREVLANLYAGAGEDAKAEEQMRQVIALRPNELARRSRLAIYLARARRLDDAQQVLVDAVKALPADDQAKLQLADFISTQRSRAEGEKVLREFIAADKDNDDLRLGLGALLQRSGADDEARKVYEELVARDGDSPGAVTARNRIAVMTIASGHLAEGQKLVDEILKTHPRDLDALTLRGNLALERGDAPQAISDLRTVLREQPESAMVRRALARAHVANKEPALAEDVLREAMRAAPNDVPIRVDLAQLLTQTNRAEQAVALLEETVKNAPTDAGAREALVRAYLVKQDLPAARGAAEDLKTLRPEAAMGYYLAGMIAQAEKRPADARREFTRALELQPGAMDSMAELTRLDVAEGHQKEALARLAAVIEREPKNALALNLYGETLFVSKDFRGAVPKFEAAIAARPDWWVPYRMLGLAKIALGDGAGGIAAYEKGMAATHYDPNLATELASHYERQGHFDASIKVYEELARRYPANQIVANNLAMLLVTHRTDKPSLDRARQLTEGFASSDTASLLDTHGWVRLKLGEIDTALPSLERAAQRAPDSRVIRFHLAMAQMQAGMNDKARSNLETVLSGTNVRFDGIDDARSALAQLKRSS